MGNLRGMGNIQGKLALKALLLVACGALLLAGCRGPLQPPSTEHDTPGTGSISLTIGMGGLGRTIQPEWPDYFGDVEFRLCLLAPSTGAGNTPGIFSTPLPVAYGGQTVRVELPTGTWDLRISALRAGDERPFARGLRENIQVGSGSNGTIAVELLPIRGGTGTFRWGIEFHADVYTAMMELTRLDEAGFPYPDSLLSVDLVVDGVSQVPYPDGLSLESGEYRVIFWLSDRNDRSAVRSAVLRIYDNMESFFGDQHAWFLADDLFTVTLLEVILRAWNSATGEWDFVAEGVMPLHFDILGIIGVTVPEFHADAGGFVYWLNRITNADNVPGADDPEGLSMARLRAMVDAALLGMAGNDPSFANASFESQQAAEDAIRDVLVHGPLPNGSLVGNIDWASGNIAVVTVIGAYDTYYLVEIAFTGVIGGYTLTQGENLAERFEWLRANALSGGMYIVEVSEDEDVAPAVTAIPAGRTNLRIVLRGRGEMRNINLAENGNLFSIPSGVTLVLYNNLTLVGRCADGPAGANNNSALVLVGTGGTLEMHYGTRIIGNTNGTFAGSTGGGVNVDVGRFIMHGGEISGNTAGQGGGIRAAGTNAFVMHGGTISGNTARATGGGVHTWLGTATFTMHSGAIYGNTSEGNGGGVFSDAPFRMIGGVVYDNTALGNGGGVFVAGAEFRMDSGTIYGNTASGNGGGVFNEGNFRIYNGLVHGNNGANENTANYGAALYNLGIVNHGTFNGAGTVFTPFGHLFTTDDTIEVEAGSLIRPGAFQRPLFPTEGSLAEQLRWLRHYAQNDNMYDIVIRSNEYLAPALTALPRARTNLHIALSGGGGMRYISLAENGNLFSIPSGVTLVLYNNLTLLGRCVDGPAGANNNTALVLVDTGGTLEMHDGTRIIGNTNGVFAGSTGGGVNVDVGRFIMHGGEISGNTAGQGGGIRAAGTNAFVMHDGTISGNTARANGGGVHAWLGTATFTMHGGAIYGNTAGENGGGVFINNAQFRMSDGTIYGNEAAVMPEANRNADGSGLGAALFNGEAVQSQLGTFNEAGTVFTATGTLTTTNDTIRIMDGEIVETLGITVSLVPFYAMDGVTVQDIDISLSAGGTTTVTVQNHTDYEAGSIRWFHDGDEITGNAISNDGSVFTMDSRIHGNRIGPHSVTVEARRENGGALHSLSINFRVGL